MKQAAMYSISWPQRNTTGAIHADYAVDEWPLKKASLASAVAIRVHPDAPFNPVSEIIAELQAIATWSGEHTNSPRRRGIGKRTIMQMPQSHHTLAGIPVRERMRDCD